MSSSPNVFCFRSTWRQNPLPTAFIDWCTASPEARATRVSAAHTRFISSEMCRQFDGSPTVVCPSLYAPTLNPTHGSPAASSPIVNSHLLR